MFDCNKITIRIKHLKEKTIDTQKQFKLISSAFKHVKKKEIAYRNSLDFSSIHYIKSIFWIYL